MNALLSTRENDFKKFEKNQAIPTDCRTMAIWNLF